jgi:hypothetical protein
MIFSETKYAFYLDFDDIDDATAYRDRLRDYGIYAKFMPKKGVEYTLEITKETVLGNFKKEFLGVQ